MTLILDGKAARAFYADRLKNDIAKLSQKPRLAIIQVGEREESAAYIKSKIKFGEEIGAKVEHIKFPESVNESEIIEKINYLNEERNTNGIIVQLPIPESLSKQKIIDAILPSKDVDGLTVANTKVRVNGYKSAIFPATARGVVELLNFYKITIKGKKVAVLVMSALAGSPITLIIQREGGFTFHCNSKIPRDEEIKLTRGSDIIIVAIGKPKFLTSEFFTEGANQTVVDVGINKISEGEVLKLKEEVPKAKFVGDVDFDNVEPIVGAITPVPGGVGQMTVLALFENLFDCVTGGPK